MDGMRVLLVDDETEFTDAIGERMRMRGLDVDTAATGEEGLDKAARTHYDAVVLDLAMPGIDGMETLRRLMEMQSDSQVIMLTAHGTIEKGVEAVKQGAADFMEKPVDFDKLLNRLKEAHSARVMLAEKRAEERIRNILRDKIW
ncbi:MAG: Transcriptional regulatory protein TcrA [candidate division BRC1 bacterium ADurb.BinA364]|nr:MAG: Transcriptional regulatory protein TcrA [candidate division BRC1 bacterium ADurb.BinA364]